MKILRVIPSLNPKGGGPIDAAKQIDTVLSSMGHEIDVVCLDAPDLDFHANYPAKVIALGPVKNSFKYSSKIKGWIRENHSNFSAVIINGIWQYHSFATWAALKNSDTPYFLYTHGMLDPWFKKRYPIKHLKKWLYWPWADYRVLRDARCVLFTSEEERQRSKESFCLYKAKEIVTPYGTSGPIGNKDELITKFYREFPDLRNKRIVLFLGRIHEKKGCDILIDAFNSFESLYPDIHLVMAGPDQNGWALELKVHVEKLKLENRVTWTGMLQGDIKWGAFFSADVLILPSHQENFGVVVAEALSCGLPVLISNKVNIWREVVVDGAAFVDEDDLAGTTENLRRWLSLDPSQCAQMRILALNSFHSRFHIKKAAEKLINLISN